MTTSTKKQPDLDRWNIVAGLIYVVIAAGCVLLAVQNQENGTIQALSLGVLSSLVTGLALLLVSFASDRRRDAVLTAVEDAAAVMTTGSQRMSGSWGKLSASANVTPDPDKFWLEDRLTAEECHSRLILVGTGHRTIFSDPTPERQKHLTEAIQRVARAHGEVKVIYPPGAETAEDIERYFRSNFTKAVLDRVELWVTKPTMPFHYGIMINDCGVWLLPKLNALDPSRAMLVEIGRLSESYYCDLYEADVQQMIRSSDRRIL